MAYPMPNKTSKPPMRSGSGGSSVAGSGTSAGAKKPESNSSWVRGLVTLIVILVVIVGGIYLISSYTGFGAGLLPGTTALSGDWQAVFLSNGQVYFGKVVNMNSDSVVLQNIYYLQVVSQPLQRSQEGEEITAGEQETEQRLTLIKLGNELHGPKDEMIINRRHVVLMEDLRPDSRVVQAINDYTSNNANQ